MKDFPRGIFPDLNRLKSDNIAELGLIDRYEVRGAGRLLIYNCNYSTNCHPAGFLRHPSDSRIHVQNNSDALLTCRIL